MRNFLFEASVRDVNNNIITLRMSRASASAASVQTGGDTWLPIITILPQTSVSVFSSGQPSKISISYGDIEFALSEKVSNEDWSNYDWSGASCRLFSGEDGADFSEYSKVFEGYCEAFEREGLLARLTLLGPEYLLQENLLTEQFAGTGAAEGQPSLRGVLKPVAFGDCQNVEPILVDNQHLVYQINSGAVESIQAYESAISLGSAKQNVATYTQLVNITLAEGEWATCLAEGLFRLGAQPSNKLSADVKTSVDQINTITVRLLQKAGLIASQYDLSTINQFNQKWSYFSTEQVSIFDVITDAFYHASGYIFANEAGVLKAGSWFSSKQPEELRQDRSSLPLIKNVKQLPVSTVFYEVLLGADRCYSTHSASEISPALSIVADEAQAALIAAQGAATDAAVARSDANIALSDINNIVSDSVLDRAEKIRLVREYNDISGERAGVIASANSFGISVSAYNTAFTNLTNYLNGLSPTWSNSGVNTNVVRNTFNNFWTGFYNSRSALLNNISAEAGRRAGVDNIVDSAGNTVAVRNADIEINNGVLSGIGTANIFVDNARVPATQTLKPFGAAAVNGSNVVKTGGGFGNNAGAQYHQKLNGGWIISCRVSAANDRVTLFGAQNFIASNNTASVNLPDHNINYNGNGRAVAGGAHFSVAQRDGVVVGDLLSLEYDLTRYIYRHNGEVFATAFAGFGITPPDSAQLIPSVVLQINGGTADDVLVLTGSSTSWSSISGVGIPAANADRTIQLETFGVDADVINIQSNRFTNSAQSTRAGVKTVVERTGSAFFSVKLTENITSQITLFDVNDPVESRNDQGYISLSTLSSGTDTFSLRRFVSGVDSFSRTISTCSINDEIGIIYNGSQFHIIKNGEIIDTTNHILPNLKIKASAAITNGSYADSFPIQDIVWLPFNDASFESLGGADRSENEYLTRDGTAKFFEGQGQLSLQNEIDAGGPFFVGQLPELRAAEGLRNSNLLPSIDLAATTADWTSVNQRPNNLAELDGIRATKIDGVDDNATRNVGALADLDSVDLSGSNVSGLLPISLADDGLRNSNLLPSIDLAATTADWTSVNQRPNNLAELNSSEGGKLSGIEANADVTKNQQVTINILSNIMVFRNSDGTVKAGQFPRIITPTVLRGSTDIRTQSTYRIVSSNSITASVSASGQIDIQSAVSTGFINLFVTVSEIEYGPFTISFATQDDPPNSGGGGSGSGGTNQVKQRSDSSIASVLSSSSVSPNQLTSTSNNENIFVLNVTSGEELIATAPLTYILNIINTSQRATGRLRARWQYRSVNSTTWISFGSYIEGDTIVVEGQNSTEPEFTNSFQTGSVNVNQTVSVAAGDYEVRLVGYMVRSNVSSINIFGGTATVSAR